MRYLRGILTVLVLFLLFGNVSADDSYEVTLNVMRPDNMNDLDNTSWSKYETIVLDKNERVTSVHKVMILDVSLETDTVFIEVIKDGERYTNFLIEGESATFGEEDELDFKIEVETIEEAGSGGGSSSTLLNDDDVVAVWIAPNSVDKLPLNAGIPESFNPSEYGKSNGWSGTGSVEEVNLYIERVQEIKGVTISITGGDWDEVAIDHDDRRKFELNENAVYVITIDYDKEDVWGGVSEEREVFTISLHGLTYGTNTGTIPSSSTTTTGGTYEDKTLDSFSIVPNKYGIVVTDTKGTWQEVDGAKVKFDAETTSGEYSWKVMFDTEGTHKIGYKETDGTSGFYRFVVKEVAPQPTETVVASQTSTGDKTSAGTVVALIGIVLLIGAGMIFYKKKSRGNSRGNDAIRTTPELDT